MCPPPAGWTPERPAARRQSGSSGRSWASHWTWTLRPCCTVNFDGGFDDFFLVERDLDLSAAVLQREEVAQVRWAELPEILDMVDQGTFIDYPKSFLTFLFDMRGTFGFPTK